MSDWTFYPLPDPPGGFLMLPGAGTPPPTDPITIPPGTAPIQPPDVGQPGPPLTTWGPNDPRPNNPIYWPGYPHWPPTGWPPTQPPLGIWGPTDPRPTNPIQLPPWAGGWQPGIWGPTDPRPSNPIYWPGYPAWPPTGGGPGVPPTPPVTTVSVLPYVIWVAQVPADQVPPFPGITPPAEPKK